MGLFFPLGSPWLLPSKGRKVTLDEDTIHLRKRYTLNLDGLEYPLRRTKHASKGEKQKPYLVMTSTSHINDQHGTSPMYVH